MSHLNLDRTMYQALTSDDFIKDYDIGVYFNTPSYANFPYIHIGISNASKIDTSSISYLKIITEINLFTKNTGDNFHLIIIEHVAKILTKKKLKIQTLMNIKMIGYETNLNADGTIINLKAKFKSVIEVKK